MKLLFVYHRFQNLLLALVIINVCYAQLPAFPGAEGAGRYTSGGRGTTLNPTAVYEVTNLNDDNNLGSLRYALSRSDTYKTIVFRISGTIHLTAKLNIRSNTTIAGQTAPGDGICLSDYPVVISGDNVIVRYIRCRMGDKNENLGMVDGSGGDDAFGNLGGTNIIIDHCTAGWSDDEALTVYRGDSVTIQWSFITEPLNYSYHFETGDTGYEHHGFGGIWGSRHGSFHHNLIAHCKGRLPRFAGSSTYPPGTTGQENADFRNNVIYNWASYSTNGGEGGNYNIVGNYYKYGPSTSTGSSSGIPIKSEIVNPYQSSFLPYPKIYLTGNYVDGYSSATDDNWKGVAMNGGTLADTVQSKVTTPFSILPITEQTATDAYNLVLNFAGCRLPARDTLDQRIANDVMNRTGQVIDVQGGYPHGTPYSQTVNAWPYLQSTNPPADSDHDGMPDDWETSHGLNPNNSSDKQNIAINGYTNLENYLNSIADDGMDIQSSMTGFSQVINSPSAIQTYSIEGHNLRGNIVITVPSGYQLSVDGGTSWSSEGSTITLNQANGAVPFTIISVRLNASNPGNYSENIIHTINGTEVTIPVNGSASVATAVGNISTIDHLIIYPNPSVGNIIVAHPPAGMPATIEVVTANGQMILRQNVAAGSVQTMIITNHFSSGIYLLRYVTKKHILTKGFIK